MEGESRVPTISFELFLVRNSFHKSKWLWEGDVVSVWTGRNEEGRTDEREQLWIGVLCDHWPSQSSEFSRVSSVVWVQSSEFSRVCSVEWVQSSGFSRVSTVEWVQPSEFSRVSSVKWVYLLMKTLKVYHSFDSLNDWWLTGDDWQIIGLCKWCCVLIDRKSVV